MATLSDARFDALRAAGYTGHINDMLLEWLADQIVRPPLTNLYLNPELAGGDAATAATGHEIIFQTQEWDYEPVPDQPGFFRFHSNTGAIEGRSPQQYNLATNNPDLVVGEEYEISYFVENLGTAGYQACVALSGLTNVTETLRDTSLPAGQSRRARYRFTVDDAGYDMNVRVGSGTTSNINREIRGSLPVLALASEIDAQPAVPETLRDAWKEMLVSQTGLPEENYHRSDYWFRLLGALGYLGNMNDREMGFWTSGSVDIPFDNAFSDGFDDGFS